MGRVGDMLAFRRPSNGGVVPDVLNLSKTPSSSQPLNTVFTSHRLAARSRRLSRQLHRRLHRRPRPHGLEIIADRTQRTPAPELLDASMLDLASPPPTLPSPSWTWA